jgi:DNA primase
MMLSELARQARIAEESLSAGTPPPRRTTPPRAQQSSGSSVSLSPVRKAIALLLQKPSAAQGVTDTQGIAESDLPGTDLLVEMLEFARQRPNVTTGTLVEHWRHTDDGRHLAKLANWRCHTPHEAIDAELAATLRTIEALDRDRRTEALLQKSLDELSELEKQELRKALSEKQPIGGDNGPGKQKSQ